VRRKKRRDVNTTAAEKRMTTVLPRMTQMGDGIIAEEKSEVCL
jgi:hypothetical protein